jgi:hypothetical protein
MKTYEYTVQAFDILEKSEKKVETSVALNELGKMGWELVSIIPLSEYNNERALFYMRRSRE